MKYTILAAAALAGLGCFAVPSSVSVVSPDGLSELRLHVDPLGYEVLRGGKPLVARSELGLTVNGAPLAAGDFTVTQRELSGTLPTPIYKKSRIDLVGREALVDFGDWGLRLVARNDGVAYRFELKRGGEVIVDDETAAFRFPSGTVLAYSVRHDSFTCSFESVAEYGGVGGGVGVGVGGSGAVSVPCGKNDIVIAPFAATVPGAGVVGITESDLLDYPGLNFRRRDGEDFLRAAFAREPDPARVKFSNRKSQIEGRFDYLARTKGTRTLPWRTFILADNPSGLVAADAAERQLVVMYHGIHKPTGLSRAYPNVLNYEGVYGLEQGHRGGGRPCLVPNDCAIPYLRMLAGPLDYTPGAMHNRAQNAPAFDAKREPCGCYGTRCHQLALFALFEAPVQMLCDSPTQYRKAAECAKFMTAVPTVWDDTVGLVGEIGRYSAIARRKGGEWWLGAITDWSARELTLSTDFLGGGKWQVEAFEDAPEATTDAERYVRRTFTIRGGEALKVKLAPGGGFAARFRRP